MTANVVLGASAVGAATALMLADKGHEVRLVTRSGTGPDHPGIVKIGADATDAGRLTEIATGADAVFNCASPAYDRWLDDWPPLHSAILAAVERTGAVLASYSNVYGYDTGSAVMTETSPIAAKHPKLRLRAEMWADAQALHDSGRIRATEVRSSDHIQPNSLISLAMFKPMLAGKRVLSPVPVDVPRSWTSVNDGARLLIAVARDPEADGRPWHVPTNAPHTARELLQMFARIHQLRAPNVSVLPWPLVWSVGVIASMVRELRATKRQFTLPFVIDSAEARSRFGFEPEPLETALVDAASKLR